MRDRSWFAGGHTGRRVLAITWLARSTGISNLSSFLMSYESHGFFPEDIDLIGTDFQRPGRADFHTLSASIAFIGVNGDIPVPRTVFKTVMSDHVTSVGGWRLEVIGKIFSLKPQT